MNLQKYLLLLLFTIVAKAQNPVLIGYWQNWNDANAPYIPLDAVDSRYNVICVSFAVPTSPSDMHMLFEPDGVSQATLISQIQTLRNQGRKVLLSIGGATTSIAFSDAIQRDHFINSMGSLLNTYHFDGIDIDIEHGNAIMAQGTISNPTAADTNYLIEAITQIKTNYFLQFNTRMLLGFAPETAYVQGGMSAYGGIWGGYLAILDHFRNDIDYLHVQLYNSGSMYGIDGVAYNQGSPDFIIAMTEAVIRGFSTAAGNFAGFPANKVVIGLPACPNAAGGGFTSTAQVAAAVQYLIGNGPQPGSYALVQSGGYPNLGGMMTWSVNWDGVSTCNASSYAYAENFETLFGPLLATATSQPERSFVLFPNPASDEINLYGPPGLAQYEITNTTGKRIANGKSSGKISVSGIASGIYYLHCNGVVKKFVKK